LSIEEEEKTMSMLRYSIVFGLSLAALSASADERLGPPKRSVNQSPPSAWILDVKQSGTFCYLPGQTLKVWRAEADNPDRLVIDNPNGQTEVRWVAQEALLEWPAGKVALEDGAVYQLRLRNAGYLTSEVRLRQVPSTIQGSEAQRAWMKKQGCQQQAAMLE
jgi:hypothetical protein